MDISGYETTSPENKENMDISGYETTSPENDIYAHTKQIVSTERKVNISYYETISSKNDNDVNIDRNMEQGQLSCIEKAQSQLIFEIIIY